MASKCYKIGLFSANGDQVQILVAIFEPLTSIYRLCRHLTLLYRRVVAVYAVKALNSIKHIRSNSYFCCLATMVVNMHISG